MLASEVGFARHSWLHRLCQLVMRRLFHTTVHAHSCIAVLLSTADYSSAQTLSVQRALFTVQCAHTAVKQSAALHRLSRCTLSHPHCCLITRRMSVPSHSWFRMVMDSLIVFQVTIFKASALWADAFYKSKCPSVCLCVRLYVCSLLRYRLTVFLPPLPEVGCPIFLEIRNPWGKVMERSGLTFEHFRLEVV